MYKCFLNFSGYIFHINDFVSPAISEDAGRMGRDEELSIRIKTRQYINQFILPTDIKRIFRLVDQNYRFVLIQKKNSQQQ